MEAEPGNVPEVMGKFQEVTGEREQHQPASSLLQ